MFLTDPLILIVVNRGNIFFGSVINDFCIINHIQIPKWTCVRPPQQISMKRKNRNRIQRKFNSCAQVFAFFFLSWLLIFFPLYDIIHIYIRLKMSTLISKGEKITQFNIFFQLIWHANTKNGCYFIFLCCLINICNSLLVKKYIYKFKHT